MIVYDKNTFASNRDIDANGYLRVEECNISKCQVRPYLGKEIPNWREFGLEPDKIYNVYCPKEELEKAAETFNNLPLTREHIEVDVDRVPKEKIVGSLGDHASFEYPYLKNNLIIYDKKDIDLVMSGKKKELSCGYRYTPVQQSGEIDGQHYDFVMTDIIGNHVALVKQGRAGRDVMVADSSKGILETIKEKIMAVFDKDLVGDEFKESEHPRAKNGQFTTAGGSGSAGKSVFIVKNKDNNTNERKFNSKEEAEKWISEQLEPIYGKERSELKELRDKKYGILEEKDEDHKELIKGSEKKEESSEKEVYSDFIKEKFGISDKTKWKSTNALRVGDIVRLKSNGKIGKVEDFHYGANGENQVEIKAYYPDDEKDDDYGYVSGSFSDFEKMDKSGEANDEKLDKKQEKVGVVMKEFKEGKLKSSSGKKVTDPKQAIAIALSEADKVAKDKDIPDEQEKPEKAGDKKALVKGEEEMTEEVKNALAEEKVDETKKEEKAVEDACGKAEDKAVDKRKLIDEIGGILKGKLSEEEWRTVIGKAETLAYNNSEASADDEDKKDLTGKAQKDFAEGVKYGEKKEKEEPKKLDSEHESEGMKKADEKKEEKKEEMAKDSAMAMDIDAIKAQAKEEVMEDFKARETARKAVRKVVGDVDVFAFDSAEEIYKFACEKSGMDLNEIVSYRDAFRGLTATKGKLALDASPISGSDVECLKDIRIGY